LKFKASCCSPWLLWDQSHASSFYLFFDYKEILSKFTFAICSIPKLFF
jgi:hypothetical protein